MAEAGTKLTTEQKIAKVRDAFDAFSRGDMRSVSDSFTDEIVWHGRGSTKFGKDFNGKQATMGNIAEFAQSFQDIKLDIHDILGNENHVVALVNSSVKRGGQTYEDHQTFVFHVNDEGKTSEAWIVSDTELLKKSLEN